MPAERVTAPERELRVARLDRGRPGEVCSQVYGEVRRGPYWFAHLVFEADVPAAGQAVFLIFCGNPPPNCRLPEPSEHPGRGCRCGDRDPPLRGRPLPTDGPTGVSDTQVAPRRAAVVHARERPRRATQYRLGHDYTTAGAFQKMRVTNWAECPHYEVVRGPLCARVRRFGFPHSQCTRCSRPALFHGPDLYLLRRSSLS